VTADFAGRVALVVGASRGIGAGTARAWATAGAAVVLAARDQVALGSVRDEITAAGGHAVAVPTDATSESAVRDLVDRTMAEYGRLDYAFNNITAGPMPGPLATTEVAAFDEGIAANIRATFLGLKYQIPAILAGGGGAVVNMASVAGVRATANLGTYVTGKAGIVALTKVAALDYADHGIRVNVVAPGPILTHHLQRAGEEAQRMAAASTPLGRVGTVDDVAHAVLWLCSAEASFITGVTLPVDGGQSAGVIPPAMYRPGHGMERARSLSADVLDRSLQQH
jgi:NAD(P)-dependent dehydrogenase (short-subunit alcohol dehydrogenase family)